MPEWMMGAAHLKLYNGSGYLCLQQSQENKTCKLRNCLQKRWGKYKHQECTQEQT